jgi:hypothetical protein
MVARACPDVVKSGNRRLRGLVGEGCVTRVANMRRVDGDEPPWESEHMLGWHVSVYKQKEGGDLPATAASPEGTRLAVWQTGLNGLDWLDELVKTGKAIHLGGNGYPRRYTATAEYIVPRIEQPPLARTDWSYAAGDILTGKWAGKTVVDLVAAAECHLDEWLLVEAWDES